MISLVDITEDNYFEVFNLMVSPEQEGYVASAVSIIARAYAMRNRNARALAIVNDGTIVGVLMYMELYEEPACYTIEQFLIDQRFQNMGFGKQALRLAIEILRKESKYDAIEICVKKEDTSAIKVYNDAGFTDTGYIDPENPDSFCLRYTFTKRNVKSPPSGEMSNDMKRGSTVIDIKEVLAPGEKSSICNCILRALPNWFGIESAIVDYVSDVQPMLFYAAFDDAQPVGFIALKKHNDYTSEVYVMGILEEYHRKGIGRKLITHCEEYCKNAKMEFLTVKTLDESRADEGYEKTRLFYLSQGFRPLEVFPLLWDESNPCLFMAKSIRQNKGKQE